MLHHREPSGHAGRESAGDPDADSIEPVGRFRHFREVPALITADVVFEPGIIRLANRLRFVSRALESGVFIVVAGSVTAIGSVHPWAYVLVWIASLLLAMLLLVRGLAARALRGRVGRRLLAIEPASDRILLDPGPSLPRSAWTFDLGRPLFPAAPLLRPGCFFLAWILLQLAPLPTWVPSLLRFQEPLARVNLDRWRPLTVSVPDTLRGLAFVACALLLHLAAAALEPKDARARLRRAVARLGLVLAGIAVVQFAVGATRIYGLFEPLEGGGAIFGPFVNRNHFAAYMVLVTPMALAVLSSAYRRYARQIAAPSSLRHRVLALSTPEGTGLIYSVLPPLATVAALTATNSRGALIAFVASLGVAGVAAGRPGVLTTALAVGFLVVTLLWFGPERVGYHFARAPADSTIRKVVWVDTLKRMDGFWLTGSGFNTYAEAMSRATPWALPLGATPWPPSVESWSAAGSRLGYRIPAGIAGLFWFREAHNDYLQVLVETGVPGLFLAFWGAAAVLRAVHGDPWRLAALAGVLMHVCVDFDFQIPAIAVLFVIIAGLRPDSL